MDHDYVMLTEKEAMWAGMLEEVLKDNGVRCVSIPVFGAGVTLRAGVQERYRILVPRESKAAAEELLQALFRGEGLPADPEDPEGPEGPGE